MRARPDTLDVLSTVVSCVHIESPTSLYFAGRAVPVTTWPGLTAQAPRTSGGSEPLIAAIRGLIYQHAYCRALDDPLPSGSDAVVDLTETLSAANRGRERWDGGWVVELTDQTGRVFVRKGDERRGVWPGSFLVEGGTLGSPQPGQRVSIHAPHEARTLQPGFYFAMSTAQPMELENAALVRFYWHILEDGAPTLVSILTERLNRFQVPFRMKCTNLRGQFGRADAAVAYVPGRFSQIALAIMAEAYPLFRDHLGRRVCLFTKRLGPGFSLAEDPGIHESFGMHRCGLVASGIHRAWSSGQGDTEGMIRCILEEFERERIDLERPHLNPGSADHYDLPHGLELT